MVFQSSLLSIKCSYKVTVFHSTKWCLQSNFSFNKIICWKKKKNSFFQYKDLDDPAKKILLSIKRSWWSFKVAIYLSEYQFASQVQSELQARLSLFLCPEIRYLITKLDHIGICSNWVWYYKTAHIISLINNEYLHVDDSGNTNISLCLSDTTKFIKDYFLKYKNQIISCFSFLLCWNSFVYKVHNQVCWKTD